MRLVGSLHLACRALRLLQDNAMPIESKIVHFGTALIEKGYGPHVLLLRAVACSRYRKLFVRVIQKGRALPERILLR